MESLANNRPFLDGNKRIAFAAAHTFLLVNGYDLEVSSLAAYEFMMQSIARGNSVSD
jgi:death on curing protein